MRNGPFTRNPDELDSVAKTIMEKRKQALAAMPDRIDEVAPPGREDQVRELKKKFPKERAFAIAWASYNKSQKEEVMLEEKDRTPKRRSPSAAALRLPQYRKKVVPSGKVYSRKNMKNEEVEPIDELSKEKLGSYYGKASASHTDAVLSKNKRKLANRTIGMGRAKALMKDETIDELSKEKLGSYYAKASASHTDAVLSKDKKKLSKRTIGMGKARSLMKDEAELLDEATRKHFRMVADLLKNIPDEGKRKEMAHHHAEVFTKQNPRFDRGRFMQAAGVDEKKKA